MITDGIMYAIGTVNNKRASLRIKSYTQQRGQQIWREKVESNAISNTTVPTDLDEDARLPISTMSNAEWQTWCTMKKLTIITTLEPACANTIWQLIGPTQKQLTGYYAIAWVYGPTSICIPAKSHQHAIEKFLRIIRKPKHEINELLYRNDLDRDAGIDLLAIENQEELHDWCNERGLQLILTKRLHCKTASKNVSDRLSLWGPKDVRLEE